MNEPTAMEPMLGEKKADPPEPAPVVAGISIKIDAQDGKVILDMGQPVRFVRMDPKLARRVAELIRQTSHRAAKGGG